MPAAKKVKRERWASLLGEVERLNEVLRAKDDALFERKLQITKMAEAIRIKELLCLDLQAQLQEAQAVAELHRQDAEERAKELVELQKRDQHLKDLAQRLDQSEQSTQASAESSTRASSRRSSTDFLEQDRPFSAPLVKEVPWEELTIFDTKEPLGSGFNGRVVEGRWGRTPVAVKEYKKAGDFERERDALSKLHSCLIVQLLGVVIGEEPKLVMELAGLSVESWCATPNYNLSGCETIAAGVLEALAYLHSPNTSVLHKDIRAANVVWNISRTAVQVLDFGLSCSLPVPASEMPVTGPIMWCAPEMLGKSLYDSKADVFSFSMLLYELLVQGTPHHGRDALALVPELLKGLKPAYDFRHMGQHGPHKLEAIMVWCWEVSPWNRPEASAALDALKCLQESEAIT